MDNYAPEEPRQRSGSFSQQKPKLLRPFNTAEVKILLLENINQTAVDAFKKQGYQVTWSEKVLESSYVGTTADLHIWIIVKQVETYPKALGGEELIEKIKDAHVIGIRSKTKLTKQVLDEAKNLIDGKVFAKVHCDTSPLV